MAARWIATLSALVVLLCFAVAVQATPPPPPLVTNGDFENSTLAPWTPYGGTVRLADQTDWTAASGNKSVELSGYGRMYQDISTTASQRYDLSFSYAGNPSASCSGLKTLDVSWSGGLPTTTGKGGSFSFDTTGRTTASMGWQTGHLLLDAASSITALAFGDDNAPVGCGIVIDNVAMGTPAATQTGTQVAGPDQWPVLGEPLTVTATVLGSSAALTPTGSLQFSVDGTPAGAPVPLTDAQAQKTFDGLARGTHTVDAVYTPDSASFASSSVRIRVEVRQAQTMTNLGAEPSPAALGEGVTLTADVDALAPGAGDPTGSVQFADEFGPIGDPVAIDADGVAQTALLEDLGDHSMYAYYSGDDDFVSSNGYAPLTVFDPDPGPTTGDPIATTTTVTSSKTPIAPGESYTATATVSPSTPSEASLDGTITFSVGGVPVGGPIPLDGSHRASITRTPAPGALREILRASYSGNADFASSIGSLSERVIAPTAPPPAGTGSPPAADTEPPIFTVELRTARLAGVLRNGIRAHVDCNENCSAVLELRLTARRAKALGLKIRRASVVVGRGAYDFPDHRTSDVVVRFSARYRKALARGRKVLLRLTTTATDVAGNDAVHVQTVTLKR